MVALKLSSSQDVQTAGQWVGDLARAAGIEDAGAVALATAEVGNNCVEFGNSAPGLLWISCKPGCLSLRFENPMPPRTCARRSPSPWPLPLTRALARRVSCQWADRRVVIRAEFGSRTGEPD